MRKVYSVFLLFCLLTACNNSDTIALDGSLSPDNNIVNLSYDEYLSIAHSFPRELNEQEIYEIVSEFKDEDALNAPRSTPYSIKNKYLITNENNESVLSRSHQSTSSITLPIYEVEIEKEFEKELLYVCADSRFANVIAYVKKKNNRENDEQYGDHSEENILLSLSEHTALNYVSKIELLKDSLREQTIEKILATKIVTIDEIINGDFIEYINIGDASTRAKPIVSPTGQLLSQVGPFTNIEWGEREPYNRKMPNLPNPVFNDMHYPLGIGAVTAATILSCLEPSMTVSSLPINWRYLKERPTIIEPTYGGWGGTPDPQDKRDMAALLCKEIYYGTKTTTTFASDPYFGGSTGAINDVILYMKIFFNMDNYQSLDVNKIYNSLGQFRPVFMWGTNTKTNGISCWTIDGYQVRSKSSRGIAQDYNLYLHGNMSRSGTDNGYYLVGYDNKITFETVVGPYSKDIYQVCNIRRK